MLDLPRLEAIYDELRQHAEKATGIPRADLFQASVTIGRVIRAAQSVKDLRREALVE